VAPFAQAPRPHPRPMARRRPDPPPPPPRGTVHPFLDLHGLTGEEAARRTERWLRDRQAEGVRTVVVVTGRGLRSPGLPVLRTEVEHLLAGLKGTLVAAWESAHAGGSFQVELRRPPAGPAPPPPPRLLRAAPPELRRRAEEALWELGVEPTPTLLEAEIRRLMEGPGEV
jgi:hypothetical protein